VLYAADLDSNQHVCPQCGYHHRIGARKRLEIPARRGRAQRDGRQCAAGGFAQVQGQPALYGPLSEAAKETEELDSLVVMEGRMHGLPVTAAAFEFRFMGGSMGSVVGERFVRGAEASVRGKKPFVCVAASGGARMQEGLNSLMQMAKTSAALTQLSANRIPFISVLTDPTMGGVSASFAMLGDIIVAEPNALIGFAGPRVIEQTVRETLAGRLPARRIPGGTWRRRPDRRPPRDEEDPGPPMRPADPQGEPGLTRRPSSPDRLPMADGRRGRYLSFVDVTTPDTLSAWLDCLEHRNRRAIVLGLDRVRAVRDRRLALDPSFPLITVGGTNGKGSTCAYLEAMLGAAGYRTGCYTSPHLLRYNERVRLAGTRQPTPSCARPSRRWRRPGARSP
jgi:acetyl-CoA carboxylase carboxyl transferase subunit beta